MSADWDDTPAGAADDEFQNEDDFAYEKDAVVFIIEVTPSLFEPLAGPTSAPLLQQQHDTSPKRRLMAILDTLRSVLFKRTLECRDAVSALIFVDGSGSLNPEEPSEHDDDDDDDDAPPEYDRRGCHLYMDLGVPNFEQLINLKLLATSEAHFAAVCTPLPEEDSGDQTAAPPTSLATAFDLAHKLLASKLVRSYLSRRVFFLTDRDTPPDAAHQRLAIRTRVKDLAAAGIELVPYFVQPPASSPPFNQLAFYEDVFVFSAADTRLGPDDLVPHDIAHTDMSRQFLALQSPKRALFHNHIELTPDLRVGVRAYALVTQKRLPLRVPLLVRTTTAPPTRDPASGALVADVSVERFATTRKQVPLSTVSTARIQLFLSNNV